MSKVESPWKQVVMVRSMQNRKIVNNKMVFYSPRKKILTWQFFSATITHDGERHVYKAYIQI